MRCMSVLRGCLGAFSPTERRNRGFVGRIAAGDTVGEMGLISGRPSNANIVALRDTELARISSEAFNKVFSQHPEAMLRIARLTVDRLELSQSRVRVRSHAARTFTLLPQSVEVDVGGFAAELWKALSTFGRAELVWNVRAGSHTSNWFHRIESANDYVVYVGRLESRTLEQPLRTTGGRPAVARPRRESARSLGRPGGAARLQHGATQRAELILVHDGGLVRGAAARWLTDLPGIPHHHVTSKPMWCAWRACSRAVVLVSCFLAVALGGSRISVS